MPKDENVEGNPDNTKPSAAQCLKKDRKAKLEYAWKYWKIVDACNDYFGKAII